MAPVKNLTKRQLTRIVISDYAQKHGNRPEDYKRYWDELDREFFYREGINLKIRKRNGHYKSCLEAAESTGCIDKLYSLAVNLFGEPQMKLAIEV